MVGTNQYNAEEVHHFLHITVKYCVYKRADAVDVNSYTVVPNTHFEESDSLAEIIYQEAMSVM